jgi:hypothetical protein
MAKMHEKKVQCNVMGAGCSLKLMNWKLSMCRRIRWRCPYDRRMEGLDYAPNLNQLDSMNSSPGYKGITPTSGQSKILFSFCLVKSSRAATARPEPEGGRDRASNVAAREKVGGRVRVGIFIIHNLQQHWNRNIRSSEDGDIINENHTIKPNYTFHASRPIKGNEVSS